MTALLNRIFHISLISHCEEMAPISHSTWKIGTNTSHILYQYLTLGEKYALSQVSRLIPLIDKNLHKSAAFCIRFQFLTVISMSSVTIKSLFFKYVIIWYQFFTRVSFDTNFSHVMIWYHFSQM